MIATALRAMADDVEARAATTAWDTHLQPTAAQQTARADRIRAVASDIRALADAAETRSVTYAEFGALKDRLYAFGFPLTSSLEQDIAAARSGVKVFDVVVIITTERPWSHTPRYRAELSVGRACR